MTLHPDRGVVHATIDDALHFSAAEREKIIKSYPAWELEARVKGLPALGSGRIFTVEEDKLRCDGVEIPAYWAQIIGVDFGFDHPFAAAKCAWDRDADVWYVVSTYREAGASSPIHSAAIRPWGTWIPVAWPHDGLQHDKGSGEALADQYRDHGLNMLPDHATHEAGGFGVEAGVQELLERMQTGRFKVMPGNEDWFEEFRLYHRDNGKIVKERDDLISCVRYGLMMRRFAAVKRGKTDRSMPRGGQYSWMG